MESEEVLISDGDGLLSAKTLEERAKAVCYIQAIVRDAVTRKDRLRRGSGFYSTVIVGGIEYYGIFTNNHVIGGEMEADRAEAVFGYDSIGEGRRLRLKPGIIFRTNKDLDYTFIGVDKNDIDALNIGLIPINFVQEPSVCVGEEIFIFQHPKGRPKEFSHEKIIWVEQPFVYYKADTETGSSGSPVLWKLRLLAVHQKGSDELNYNKGTLCSEILSHLNTGTYTEPKMMIMADSQDKEIDEERCPISFKRRKMEITEEFRTGLPTEDELDCLAKDIVKDWKHLGRKLKVPNSTLEEISRDHVQYQGMREKAFQMLISWKENSSTFSYATLGEALVALGKSQLARVHCGQ